MRGALTSQGVDFANFRNQVESATGESQDHLLSMAQDVAAVIRYEEQLAAARAREEEQRRRGREWEREQQRRAQMEGTYRFSDFFSQEEQMDYLRMQLTESFKSLRLEMPETREGFRNLVSTLQGGVRYSVLDLHDEFLRLTESVEATSNALARQQNIYRDLREEIFVTSAEQQTTPQTFTESSSILRQLVVAVQSGNINQARLLSDLISETSRSSYEPTEQKL